MYLYAQADGSMPLVGALCRLHRVVVDVDDLVQVPGGQPCHLCQLLKVKLPALPTVSALAPNEKLDHHLFPSRALDAS